jgi:predicted metal-dependent hydrolase
MPTADTTHRLEYGNRHIDYLIRHTDRKRLRLTVTPAATLDVIAPMGADPDRVTQLVHEKAPWVFRKMREVEAFHPLPEPLQYISGETIRFLGRQYRLKVHQGPHVPAKLYGRYLHVTVPDKADSTLVKAAVTRWYRKRADILFNRYLEEALPIAKRHGIPEPTLTIRQMRTRWGSCTANGRITLNLALIQTPVHCIEYVIMHELCHLKHHNHSKAFYSLLTRCMPDWQARKSVLVCNAIAA